jgi:hypothetical protein
MASTVDREGVRTLGVLTKLDLMDQGTNCVDVSLHFAQSSICNIVVLAELIRHFNLYAFLPHSVLLLQFSFPGFCSLCLRVQR